MYKTQVFEGSKQKRRGSKENFNDRKKVVNNPKAISECPASSGDVVEQRRLKLKPTTPEIKKKEDELRSNHLELQKAHSALEVLLKKRETDKKDLEENILMNLRNLFEPYLEKLEKSQLDDIQKSYLNILQSTLTEVVSPFSKSLSSKYLNFTPSEIRVAYLVKQGKTTKEIADLLRISCKTVGFHRENIRNKLGLKNKRANLRIQLLSFG